MATKTGGKKGGGKGTAAKRTRAKIKKLAKKPPPRKEHPPDVKDAMKVYRAAKKYLAVLKKKGLTAAELEAFDAQIKQAIALEGVVGPISLDDARKVVKDLTGEFRTAAKLAANGLGGRDAKMLEALRADVAFPPNDELLAAYLTGIDGVMKPYASKLAERDFPAAKQAALVHAAKTFDAALKARPEENDQRHAKVVERDQAFHELRTMTSYVREVGRAALLDSPKRSDFDRQKPAKKKKPEPTPTP